MSAADDFEEAARRLRARQERNRTFFIPGIVDPAIAEATLRAVATFHQRPVPPLEDRLRRVAYTHNDEYFVAEVGVPVDPYYYDVNELVLVILPGDPLLICSRNRGVERGAPICVGASSVLKARFFGEGDER